MIVNAFKWCRVRQSSVRPRLRAVGAAGSVAAADISEACRGLKVATVFGAVTMRAQDNQLALPNYLGCAVPKGGSVMVEVTQSYGADVAGLPAASIRKL